MRVTKAIIPVAGWGTRRLPITKSIEKCMLPIGNVPVIDYVVKDCIRAGITDIYFVVSGEARQLKAYYSRNEALEAHLRQKNKLQLIADVAPPNGIQFHYISQDTSAAYGTTVPVWLCRDIAQKDEQVLVIMGDQFFYRSDGGSNAKDLIDLVASRNIACGLLGTSVPREEVYKYGVIEKDEQGFYQRIIEHPKPDEAPSTLNNASFYLFDYKMFRYIDEDMRKPHAGEYMIIDPINEYSRAGNKVIVGEAKGKYLDAGTVEGWLHANQVVLTEDEG